MMSIQQSQEPPPSAVAHSSIFPLGNDQQRDPLVSCLDASRKADIKINKIRFKDIGMLDSSHVLAWEVENVLSTEECASLIYAVEHRYDLDRVRGWHRATNNENEFWEETESLTRSCSRLRLMAPDLWALIWSRIEPHLPELQRVVNKPEVTAMSAWKGDIIWQLQKLNERVRFLKYIPGDFIKPHFDETFTNPQGHLSLTTLFVYLNGCDEASESIGRPMSGGETVFHSRTDFSKIFEYTPKLGSAMVFEQMSLLHSGAPVLTGEKWCMKGDIMYSSEFVPATK